MGRLSMAKRDNLSEPRHVVSTGRDRASTDERAQLTSRHVSPPRGLLQSVLGRCDALTSKDLVRLDVAFTVLDAVRLHVFHPCVYGLGWCLELDRCFGSNLV